MNPNKPTSIEHLAKDYSEGWGENNDEKAFLAGYKTCQQSELSTLKEENERLKQELEDSKSDAAEWFKAAVKDAKEWAAIQSRIKELEQWKESAVKVMPDFQEIGKLLNIPLGTSVSEQIIPEIKRLKKEAEIKDSLIYRKGCRIKNLEFKLEHPTSDAVEFARFLDDLKINADKHFNTPKSATTEELYKLFLQTKQS